MPTFHGHARVNPRHPQASAVCDRCGFLWNRVKLQAQMAWAGNRLIDTKLRVCKPCLDVPNLTNRGLVTADFNDPVPIRDPRPDLNGGYQPDVFQTQDGTPFNTETGIPIVRENGA